MGILVPPASKTTLCETANLILQFQEGEKERYKVKRRELDRAAETAEAELERIKNR